MTPDKIEYCNECMHKVGLSLIDAGLSPEMSRTEKELMEKLSNGIRDPYFELTHMITSAAAHLFGIGFVIEKGCPLCALDSTVEYMTRHIKETHFSPEVPKHAYH